MRREVARPVRERGVRATQQWATGPYSTSVALLLVKPKQSRTREQTAYLDQLIQINETIPVAFKLAQDFGCLLRNREGQIRLEQWKASVRASGIAELMAFVEGLADDAAAVANGCSLTWSNGIVEGFINKVKWIKRSCYGQAGFALLQRRVLLHPAGDALHHEQSQRASSTSALALEPPAGGSRSTTMALEETRIA